VTTEIYLFLSSFFPLLIPAPRLLTCVFFSSISVTQTSASAVIVIVIFHQKVAVYFAADFFSVSSETGVRTRVARSRKLITGNGLRHSNE